MYGAGTIQRRGYFIQLEPDNQCGNNSWAGRIQRNTVDPYIILYLYKGMFKSLLMFKHLTPVIIHTSIESN